MSKKRTDNPNADVPSEDEPATKRRKSVVLRPPPTMESITKKWTFFSDHLPVGLRFPLTRREFPLTIVTLNLLCKSYMHWIERFPKAQYFGGSILTKEHDQTSVGRVFPRTLDTREKRQMAWIKRMMEQRISIICLQEVSVAVLLALHHLEVEDERNDEDTNYAIHSTNDVHPGMKSCEVVLYDRRYVSCTDWAAKPYTEGEVDNNIITRCHVRYYPNRHEYEGFIPGEETMPNAEYTSFILLSTHVGWARGKQQESYRMLEQCMLDEVNCAISVICCGDFNVGASQFAETFPLAKHYFKNNRLHKAPTHVTAFDCAEEYLKIAKFDYVLLHAPFNDIGRDILRDMKMMEAWRMGSGTDDELLQSLYFRLARKHQAMQPWYSVPPEVLKTLTSS